jgi:hypothetical protein
MALGCLAGGYGMEKLGRRRMNQLLCLPFIAGWLLMAMAHNVQLLIAGRFLTGTHHFFVNHKSQFFFARTNFCVCLLGFICFFNCVLRKNSPLLHCRSRSGHSRPSWSDLHWRDIGAKVPRRAACCGLVGCVDGNSHFAPAGCFIALATRSCTLHPGAIHCTGKRPIECCYF